MFRRWVRECTLRVLGHSIGTRAGRMGARGGYPFAQAAKEDRGVA